MKKVQIILAILFSFSLIFPVLSQAQKNEIKLGLAVSKTGKFSTEGVHVFQGLELWVEAVNAKGGIYVKALGKKLPIKWIWYDDNSDASTSARLYEKLIVSDEVDMLIGPWGSGQTFAATAVTEKHKFPIVLTSAASDNIYERGFKYIFQGGAMLSSRIAVPYGTFLGKHKDKIKSIGLLYEDFVFPLTLYKEIKKALMQNDVKIVMEEKFPMAATDYSSLLMKVKNVNPDGIIFINVLPSSIYFTRQMAEYKIRPKFFAVNIGPFAQEFRDAVGDLSLGIFETGFWDFQLPFKGSKEFGKAYEKKYGKVATADDAHAFRAGEIWEEVLAKAGTFSKEEFNRILHSETFTTIEGNVKYNEKGINISEEGFLCQLQKNGPVREIVWPEKIVTKKAIIPYQYFK